MILEGLEKLPTGKEHISYSELRDWRECSYKHKLRYIDKVDVDKPSVLLDFGKAVHLACERYLRTRCMDVSLATTAIENAWTKNGACEGYTGTFVRRSSTLDTLLSEAKLILDDVPAWFDGTFSNWTFIDAEHQLYEPIQGHMHAFKGFIDGIIACDGVRGKPVFWLIDWKTTTWGWTLDKKSDDLVRSQLVLYKNFWSSKTKTNLKDIRCGFVLLKRTGNKNSSRCELIMTSVGDVTIKRSLDAINNMLCCTKRGTFIKNRLSCRTCDYRDTRYCT